MAEIFILNTDGKAVNLVELDKQVCSFWNVLDTPDWACPKEEPKDSESNFSWISVLGYYAPKCGHSIPNIIIALLESGRIENLPYVDLFVKFELEGLTLKLL